MLTYSRVGSVQHNIIITSTYSRVAMSKAIICQHTAERTVSNTILLCQHTSERTVSKIILLCQHTCERTVSNIIHVKRISQSTNTPSCLSLPQRYIQLVSDCCAVSSDRHRSHSADCVMHVVQQRDGLCCLHKHSVLACNMRRDVKVLMKTRNAIN
jgi:hypothetical protein